MGRRLQGTLDEAELKRLDKMSLEDLLGKSVDVGEPKLKVFLSLTNVSGMPTECALLLQRHYILVLVLMFYMPQYIVLTEAALIFVCLAGERPLFSLIAHGTVKP